MSHAHACPTDPFSERRCASPKNLAVCHLSSTCCRAVRPDCEVRWSFQFCLKPEWRVNDAVSLSCEKDGLVPRGALASVLLA